MSAIVAAADSATPVTVTAAVTGQAQHVDALTGVRALAAGWVVAFHFWLNAGRPSLALPPIGIDFTPLVAVGWLGVDVFFILSGFVLTWQVLHQRPALSRAGEDGVAAPSFARFAGTFLRRRILRVFPAYLACLSVLLPLAYFGIYRTLPSLGDIALHLVMFHNMVPEYIDSINGVFWSMPFEWQFYLVFPLLVLPVLRGRTRWMVGCALGVALAMKLVSALHGPGREIAQLTWRIDEFAAGMAAAAIAARAGWSRRACLQLTWIGAALLVTGAWIVGLRDATWWQPGAMPIIRAAWIDICVAALLVGLSGSTSALAGLFASRVMVWLGAVSYSIYLWHLPTLELTRRLMRTRFATQPVALDYVVALVAILAVSALSYYLIERPFHAPAPSAPARWRDPRRRTVIIGAWMLAILVVAAAR